MTPAATCPRCGSPVAADDRFCAGCGAALLQPAPAAAQEPSGDLPRHALEAEMPERSLREIYFELGLKLTEAGRAVEALAAFESAHREGGDKPQPADLLVALALAAQETERAEQAVRYLLEAALVDEAPRRDEIVAHLLGALTASAAVAHGRWLIEQWWPRYRVRAQSARETLRARLLTARTQLFLANFDEAIGLLGSAAAEDALFARAEFARLLAPEKLPRALATDGADTALVIARIWRALGDSARALRAVDDALAAVTGAGYPDAPIRALRGELLLDLGDPAEAARSLHQAGNRYLWRNEAEPAAGLLARAVELDPANVEARWSLADALFLASYGPDLDAQQRRQLTQRARAAWDAGYAIRPPGKSDAWAYATAAHIAVRQAELAPSPQREPALWQAAALIERALLLTPEQPMRWGNLCTFHRGLMNQQTALAAALRGHELEPHEWDPLSEVVIIQTNLGRWEEATAALEKLEQIKKTAWTAFVAARLHLYCGRKEEALPRIDEALQAEPANLTYLASRAMALRHLGRYDESRAVAQAILRRFDIDDRDNLTYFGWAAIECGERERALQAYEADLRYAGDVFLREACLRNLALARLANGHIEAAREAFLAGTQHPIDREGRWLIEHDLDDLVRFAAAWGGRERIAPALDEFRRRLQGLPQAVAPSAYEELEAALAGAGDSVWQRVGASAGLARMDREGGDYAAAARRYAELQQRWPQRFPEAGLGIDGAVDGLRQSTSIAEYWAQRDATPAPPPWQQRFFETYLATRCKLTADAAESTAMPAVVTPIAVEMDAALIPRGDDRHWPILKSYLPEMRERIERDTGVRVPGTRLRSNEDGDLSPNRALIMLGEVPLAMVRVVRGGAYCLADAARIEALGFKALESETDALDLTPACWVDAKNAARVSAAGVAVIDDPHAYIVRRLEALLRRNLADFIGVDEVDLLLGGWRGKFGRAETIDPLRADDAQLLRFTRLLRRLARERVSVADGAAILDAVGITGMADADAALRAVRLRLRDRIAASAPRRMPLGAAVERRCLDWLHEADAKTFLALPPEDAQEIFAEVRQLVAGAAPPVALVVESARLRPHLRELLELEFPDVAVLAAEELASIAAEAVTP
jgi:predicted Zn-dependent protease